MLVGRSLCEVYDPPKGVMIRLKGEVDLLQVCKEQKNGPEA